ncbi:Thymus-specific serine protease, partial [Rhizoclosmatium hyalinum]
MLPKVTAAAASASSKAREDLYLRPRALNVVDSISQANLPPQVAPAGLPVKQGYYKQTVDHFGNQKGVNGTHFDQLYFIQEAFYKSGGPGESQADDGNLKGIVGSILSWLLPRYGALGVSLEHRFYGTSADTPGRSTPTADLSLESLKLLTADQAIEDIAEFITNFPTLFPEYKLTSTTKWISIGGSYPGALSAWLRQQHPELIYAAHASSAPVNLVEDFWRFSYALDQGMTFQANNQFHNGNTCMKGWTRAVKAFDEYITANLKNPAALKSFKSKFWLSQLENTGDFATYVTSTMGGTVQYFADLRHIGNKTTLETICDGQVNPAFTNPKANDAELLATLQSFTIQRSKQARIKGDNDPTILAYYATTGGPVADNLWAYQSCNQYGYFQTGQPLKSGLIESYSVYSQYNNVEYNEWICKYQGVTKKNDSIPASIKKEVTYWGGLNIEQDNILWVNGQYDPWHWLSNYDVAYEGQGSLLYANASHCNDLWGPTSKWPVVSDAYSKSFWDQIFATYDKWIL